MTDAVIVTLERAGTKGLRPGRKTRYSVWFDHVGVTRIQEAECRQRTGTSRGTRSTGSASCCGGRRFAIWSRRRRQARRRRRRLRRSSAAGASRAPRHQRSGMHAGRLVPGALHVFDVRARGRRAARRPCRCRRPVPAPGCSGRAGTCGRATRTASSPRSSSARGSASPWSPGRGDWSARRARGSSADSSSMRAITSRVFSPPESARILFSVSSPENWKAPSRLRSAPVDSFGKSFSICSQTVRSGLSTSSACCAKYPIFRLAPRRMSPESGASAPATILSSVVLPAPFRPMTHQRSPRRMVSESPS